MRQSFSITPQLSCVHDHARLRKNLVGHWRTGYGRMTATLTFEPQKIQKLLKTYDLYWFILSSMIKTFEWNKKQSALSWEKWSHPCQCFLGCRINIKEKTLKKCSWPFKLENLHLLSGSLYYLYNGLVQMVVGWEAFGTWSWFNII